MAMSDERDWVTDNDLVAMQLERTVNPSETAEQASRRIIVENAPIAAYKIVELARNARSEGVRLNAAKYIIDRVHGKIGELKDLDPKKDAFEELYEIVARNASDEESKAIERAQGRLK